MSDYIAAALAAFVRERAGEACEYCLLPQCSQEATFHIDHIRPRVNDGETTADNLALACVTCSLRKAARTVARDPASGKAVPLFHPRRDRWAEHFRWTRGGRLRGLTPTGRATIAALGMNRAAIVLIRKMLAALGQFPLPRR
jgi:hypothetical protein